jgi:hypothetical protein
MPLPSKGQQEGGHNTRPYTDSVAAASLVGALVG